MRKVNLKQPQDVRRLLARVVNMSLGNEIETGRANSIGQLCTILLKAMQETDLELRIGALEKAIEVQNEQDIRKAG